MGGNVNNVGLCVGGNDDIVLLVGNAVKTSLLRSSEGGAEVGNIIEIAFGIISAVSGISLGIVWSFLFLASDDLFVVDGGGETEIVGTKEGKKDGMVVFGQGKNSTSEPSSE
mmetsp:Transcript_26642/g.41223  ORF Transcript_26642/g.41223 Transcript_26642/m.41223 type:complete len:112 (-) Transcript_26642:283-618(-)